MAQVPLSAADLIFIQREFFSIHSSKPQEKNQHKPQKKVMNSKKLYCLFLSMPFRNVEFQYFLQLCSLIALHIVWTEFFDSIKYY